MSHLGTSTFTGSVFVAASLDGYIATRDGELDWLTRRAELAGDTGYMEFIASVDAVAMGRNTYEKVLSFPEWPYENLKVFVLSATLDPAEHPRVRIAPSTERLLEDLTSSRVRHVYVDGGMLIRALLEWGRIHNLTLTTAPVILGNGVPLFGLLTREIDLQLEEIRALGGGFMQARYSLPSAATVRGEPRAA